MGFAMNYYDKRTYRRRVVYFVAGVIVGLVLGGGWLWRTELTEARDQLTEVRQQAVELRSYAGRDAVPKEWRKEFSRCDKMGEYQELSARPPSELNNEELAQALDIHQECAFYYPNKREFSSRLLNRQIEKLFFVSPKAISDEEKQAQMVNLWSEQAQILLTQAEYFRRLAEINGEFWQVEKEHQNGELTGERRNEQITELNQEARGLMEDRDRLGKKRRKLAEEEEELWHNLSWTESDDADQAE